MKGLLNQNGVEAAVIEVLKKNEGRMSPSFLTNLRGGRIKVLPTSKILRHRVTDVGGASYPLIDAETVRLRGVSDFDKDHLPKNTVLIINELRIGYKADAAEGKEALLSYANAMPVSFRNAKLIVNQKGKLFDYPISELTNPHTGRNREDDYVGLALPVVIVDEEDFQINIEFPKGATAATGTNDKEYLEISFKGFETTGTSQG